MAKDIPDGFLIVDDRENDKVIHKLIMRLGDAKTDPEGKVWVTRLKTGDYIIDDWIIEAKEINDLAKSITGQGRSRTIAAQLRDMCNFAEKKKMVPWLTVYGETTDLKPWVARRFGKGKKRSMAQDKTIAKVRMKNKIKTFKK